MTIWRAIKEKICDAGRNIATQLDDDNLIANGLRDQEAFNVLFSKYRHLLYSPASRVLHSHDEAEDAVQNSSLLAFCKLRSFKHEGAFRRKLSPGESIANHKLTSQYSSIVQEVRARSQKLTDPESGWGVDHPSIRQVSLILH